MAWHLAVCVPAHDAAGAAPAQLFRLRVEAPGNPLYGIRARRMGGISLAVRGPAA